MFRQTLTCNPACPRPLPPSCRHGDVPEALAAVAGSLQDGSHPRPPAQMPRELEKALVAAAFPDYDRKVCVQGLGVRPGPTVDQEELLAGQQSGGPPCASPAEGHAASSRARPPAPPPPPHTHTHCSGACPPLQVRPSTCVARQCGNMYTASIWSGIPQVCVGGGRAAAGPACGGGGCGLLNGAGGTFGAASMLRCDKLAHRLCVPWCLGVSLRGLPTQIPPHPTTLRS
jgi:hypothetical protein